MRPRRSSKHACPMRPLQRVIYMDDSSKFFKCCGYSYRLVYYRPSTSYRVEPTSKGLIKRSGYWHRPTVSIRATTNYWHRQITWTCVHVWMDLGMDNHVCRLRWQRTPTFGPLTRNWWNIRRTEKQFSWEKQNTSNGEVENIPNIVSCGQTTNFYRALLLAV